MNNRDIKFVKECLATILCFCIWKPFGFLVLILFCLVGGSNE